MSRLVLTHKDRLLRFGAEIVKCQRLFRPQFSKFKTSFFVEIREVSDTLTPNVGVSRYTPV